MTIGELYIARADLYADIIGFGQQKFFQEADGFRLAIVLQVNSASWRKRGRARSSPLVERRGRQAFEGRISSGASLAMRL